MKFPVVYELLRAQRIIDVLGSMNDFCVTSKIVTGNIVTGTIEGNFDGVESGVIGYTCIGNLYIFSANDPRESKFEKEFPTYENNLAVLSMNGFFDGALMVMMEKLFKEIDVVDFAKSIIFTAIMANVNLNNSRIMENVKYDHNIAFVDIADVEPLSQLRALSLFEDTVGDTSKLILQYYGGEGLNKEEFEEIAMAYVDEVEPMEEVMLPQV